jgi:Co/Zn/Cd efflux system component
MPCGQLDGRVPDELPADPPPERPSQQPAEASLPPATEPGTPGSAAQPAQHPAEQIPVPALRRAVGSVGLLNFSYFFVEVSVALAIGSVSLLADSVDFLEDTAIAILVFVALGWSLHWRSRAGKAMALIILVPAAAAAWQAISKFAHPTPPDPLSLALTAGGAAVVNGISALVLVRVRHHGGSLSRAAFLSARNDVLVNVAIIAVGGVTAWTGSGWPDIILGLAIVAINSFAAKEVWEAAEEERLAARALAGEDID